jgi:hypothetical protein
MDDFDDDVFGEDTDEAEAMMSCGRTDDGICMLAGTEHCDFECPYRDALP